MSDPGADTVYMSSVLDSDVFHVCVVICLCDLLLEDVNNIIFVSSDFGRESW